MGIEAEQKNRLLARFFISTPTEFYEQGSELGEVRLVLAMIERAVLDFYSVERLHNRSAYGWIFDEVDIGAESPFSFNWCCDVLGWQPQEFRDKLAKQLAKKHRGLYCLKNVKQKTAKPAVKQIQADSEIIH